MSGPVTYVGGFDPPAPVVPLRVARPGAAEAVLLPALVDTGADCTLIPAAVARHLGLPVIDRVSVQGLGGAVRRVPVHAASAAFGGLRVLARLAAYEAETILGRDLLNRAVALLDGPAQKVALRRGRAGGGRASSKRARSAGRGRRSG